MKKSEQLVQQRQMRINAENVVDDMPNIQKFDELYVEALVRQKRQQKLSELNPDTECTFQPQLVARQPDSPFEDEYVHSQSKKLGRSMDKPIMEEEEQSFAIE